MKYGTINNLVLLTKWLLKVNCANTTENLPNLPIIKIIKVSKEIKQKS